MDPAKISFLNFDATSNHPDLDILEQFLSQERLERNLKYLKEADRKRSILAESLVRFSLIKDFGISPDRISFGRDANGRPFLETQRSIQFNLSHSGNWVGCIIETGSGSGAVGIDIEQIRQDLDPLETGTIFSGREKDAIKALNADDRLKRFFQLWTLKESYTKALGLGVGRSFDTFRFEWDNMDSIKLFDPLDQRNTAFQFQSISLDEEHLSAACFPDGRNTPEVNFILLSELIKGMKKIESRD